MDGDRSRTTTEDDVTEPDDLPIEVPDADRAEQEALVALPRWVTDPREVGDREADEADVLEQESGVRVDGDELQD